ncbi:hypothetical protein ACM66B_005653 [Microbotryomycetes sp. NB124-2]
MEQPSAEQEPVNKRVEPLGRVKQARASPLRRHAQVVDRYSGASNDERTSNLSLALRDREIRLRRLTTAQPTSLRPYDRRPRPANPLSCNLAQQTAHEGHLHVTQRHHTPVDIIRSSLGVVKRGSEQDAEDRIHTSSNDTEVEQDEPNKAVYASDLLISIQDREDTSDATVFDSLKADSMLDYDERSDGSLSDDSDELIITYHDPNTHKLASAPAKVVLDVATEADEIVVLAESSTSQHATVAVFDAEAVQLEISRQLDPQSETTEDVRAIQLSSVLEQAAIECNAEQDLGSSHVAAAAIVDVDMHRVEVDPPHAISPLWSSASVPVHLDPVSGSHAMMDAVFEAGDSPRYMSKTITIIDDDSSASEDEDESVPSKADAATTPEPGQSQTSSAPKKVRHINGFKIRRDGKAMDGKDDFVQIDDDMLHADRDEMERITPKSYQTAILEQAKTGNVIACLPTGSGKTLIAVLLMDWMHNTIEVPRMKEGKKQRMQFFVTNSVPLVHQQSKIIAYNTDLRVGKVFGALNIDLCSAEEWRYNFEHFDCLCLTAQLLLDSLAHGFIGIENISLLVFDEAHHAKSNHPFASILRHFLNRAPPELRPKVLGMTASPVSSNEGVKEVRRLQTLFDAKLLSAPKETLEELRKMVARPTILHVLYDKAPPYELTDLTKEIVVTASTDSNLDAQTTFKKYLKAAETALIDFGPDACDLMWHLFLRRFKDKYMPWNDLKENELTEVAMPSGELRVKRDDVGKVTKSASVKPKIAESDRAEGGSSGQGANDWPPAAQALDSVQADATDVDMVPSKECSESQDDSSQEKAVSPLVAEEPEPDDLRSLIDWPLWMECINKHTPTLNLERLSPKLRRLIEMLAACAPSADIFCGIVFVKRRMDALLIAQILKELSGCIEELGWIRVDCVTGHGNGASGVLGSQMAWARQTSILHAFEEGQTNLLVATSVVEEGLDVQPCNFVARYDLYDTHISFVQSKGRARAVGSHYLLFVEEDNIEEHRKLMRISQLDKELEQILTESGSNTPLELEPEEDDFDADASMFLTDETTRAYITPHFALSLLHRYCSSLPTSDLFASSKPQFEFQSTEEGFVCEVTLPSNAKVRNISSAVSRNSKAAKRAVAFHAIRTLKAVNALDHHFLPIRTFAETIVRDERGRRIGSRKREVAYKDKLADVWKQPNGDGSEQETLYGTVLRFVGRSDGAFEADEGLCRPILLLTRTCLPPTLPLKLYSGTTPIVVMAEPLGGSIEVAQERRAMLSRYTLHLWLSALAKTIKLPNGEEPNYFFAPLVDDGVLKKVLESSDIDWKAVQRVLDNHEETVSLENPFAIKDAVLIDEGRHNGRYYHMATRTDLTPLTQGLEGTHTAAGHKNVLEYYKMFASRLLDKREIVGTQPLFEVMKIPKIAMLLAPAKPTRPKRTEGDSSDKIRPVKGKALKKQQLRASKQGAKPASTNSVEMKQAPGKAEAAKTSRVAQTEETEAKNLTTIAVDTTTRVATKFPTSLIQRASATPPDSPIAIATESASTACPVAQSERQARVAMAVPPDIGHVSLDSTATAIDSAAFDGEETAPASTNALEQAGATDEGHLQSTTTKASVSKPAGPIGSADLNVLRADSQAETGDPAADKTTRRKSKKRSKADVQNAAGLKRFAIPQLCKIHTLPGSIFRTASMLPSIMTALEQNLLVAELNTDWFKDNIDPHLVRQSLMTPAACMGEDYERLELLGDAALKTIASIYCFAKLEKTCHEGDLHVSRLSYIANACLFKSAVAKNLPAYLMARPFASKHYLPQKYEFVNGKQPNAENHIGDKTIADVVEALMGAAYETGMAKGGLSLAYDLSLQAAIAVGVPLEGVNVWDDFYEVHGPITPPARPQIDVSAIEKKLGHKFRYPHLVQEALTHPSKTNAPATFQRLEWLGDSALDLLVIRYCWSRFGELSPGQMTDLKGAMVGNEALAAISIELGLEKYMLFENASLARNVAMFRQKCRRLREEEIALAETEKRRVRPYWLMSDPPKAVADIVESLFGAVLVDSHFDPSSIQIPFDKILEPWFTKWVTPTSLRIDSARHFIERTKAAGCDDSEDELDCRFEALSI